jgi:citrate lyase alpha subunit
MGDKCVDTYLASIDCKGIQNKVLAMSALSSLIGSLINAIETEPIIAK